jgi:hypothetical protein
VLEKLNGTRTTTTIDGQYKIWDKVISEIIFFLLYAKRRCRIAITKRSLMGFRPGKVNTKIFENLENVIAKEPDTFIKQVKQGNFWNVKGSKRK